MRKNFLLTLTFLAIAATALGAFLSPADFLRSWLLSFEFWLELPLGACALLLLWQLSGGQWGEAIRPSLMQWADVTPWLSLAFVPIAFGLSKLYPWVHSVNHYLNPFAFLLRALLYWLAWTWISRVARMKHSAHAAPALILCALTVTFASIDWMMSLEPGWKSTIYGLLVWCRQGLAALSVGLLVLPKKTERKTAGDLGNLLLALSMTWAYLTFMQYLIIWTGNLPEETRWYEIRNHGGWQWIVGLVAVCQFAIPFSVLLFREFKRRTDRLAALGALLLFSHALEMLWFVAPSFEDRQGVFHLHWLDLSCFLAIGGMLLWIIHLKEARDVR
jgi:hypothetical protein